MLVWLKQSDRPCSAGGVDSDAMTFEPCCRFVDEWLTASEPEIARAMVGALDQHDERLEGELSAYITRRVAAACTLHRDANHDHLCLQGQLGSELLAM